MRLIGSLLVLLFVIESVGGFGSLCASKSDNKRFPTPTFTPKNFKVAFLGDSGNGTPQRNVLNMVRNWGAQVVIHSGDFDYDDDPASFETAINAALGPNFPYFASIGNHDEVEWEGNGGYQDRFIARLERFGATDNCTGDYGVNMYCSWYGLNFVLSGPGTWGSGHAAFIDDAFSNYPSIWRFVSWHKNQRLMQIGGKTDETGWTVYDTTRENGAIVVTGHEHSYCRSYMMSNFQRQTIANRNATLNLKPQESFVFVSGLGGESIRSWDDDLVDNAWWAAVAADDNNVADGALLCIFNTVNERTAECEFRDTNGRTWDEFTVYSQNPNTMEEHLEALRQKEEIRAQAKCTDVSPFIEVTVSGAKDDIFEDENGMLQCGSKVITVGKGPVALRFRNVPLKKGSPIKHAYLQVYGDITEKALPHFVISGFNGKAAPVASLICQDDKADAASVALHQLRRQLPRGAKGTQVIWEKEDEGWERHTVWVSPDIKEIINEVINHPNWNEGDDILIKMEGDGNRGFFSTEKGACFAPTLAFELTDAC